MLLRKSQIQTYLGFWLSIVAEYKSPKLRFTAYEIAAAVARGHHPKDDELAEIVGVHQDTILGYRVALKRDGLLDWETGRGRGKTNVYVLKLQEKPAWRRS